MVGLVKTPMLLWTDIEATGLDPNKDDILEVAFKLTDMSAKDTVWSYQSVVYRQECNPDSWVPFVKDMHTKNGLIAELKSGQGKSVDSINTEVCTSLYTLVNTYTLHMAGNSIHYDRRMLERDFNNILTFIHYRQLDITSLRIFGDKQGVPASTKKLAHRASDDIEESIAQYQYYLQTLTYSKVSDGSQV